MRIRLEFSFVQLNLLTRTGQTFAQSTNTHLETHTRSISCPSFRSVKLAHPLNVMWTHNALGIACDIGIENRLAIENTRLLLTYATIDPARVRTLVLFCMYRDLASSD